MKFDITTPIDGQRSPIRVLKSWDSGTEIHVLESIYRW